MKKKGGVSPGGGEHRRGGSVGYKGQRGLQKGRNSTMGRFGNRCEQGGILVGKGFSGEGGKQVKWEPRNP